MKVFVAGATGVLGRPLVRALVADGHEVTGLTRYAHKRASIEGLGARAAVADALDADALARVVREAQPTHVVHLLTALPPAGAYRPRGLRPTNRVRIEGTANLLRAARAAEARRVVAESFVGVYGTVRLERAWTEEDPMPEVGRGPLREAVLAMRSLEAQLLHARVDGLETVALRYGLFYGADVPAVRILADMLRAGKVYLPRGADGVASFIHVDDAVSATMAALEAASPSAVYNVVDDDPLPLDAYVRLLAASVGAPAPRSMPSWILDLVAPVIARASFARVPLSNLKARRELGWTPAHPSVRGALPDIARALGDGMQGGRLPQRRLSASAEAGFTPAERAR
jgi:nucleoside-diphosphate-sugar epimerase